MPSVLKRPILPQEHVVWGVDVEGQVIRCFISKLAVYPLHRV